MKVTRFWKTVCSVTVVAAMLAGMLPGNLLKVSASGAWDAYSSYLNSDNPKKEDMRALWITTVYNSDWPSAASAQITDTASRIAEQKQELNKILDTAVADHMNAVMLQVRSQCDALYQSDLVPWSSVLTGTTGQDPGWDPLAYAVEEAHKRGLELQAWMNPYRAATAISDATVAQLKNTPNSIFATHPDWIRKAYDGTYVIDPGIPAARAWVESCVMEVVQKYNVDGIHFDDYFYHESTPYGFDDTATFAQYGAGFADRGDWRRNNTYQLIKELSQQMHAAKPWMEFGIAPAGMWGNIKDGHPDGSATAGGEPNYDRDFADTLRWANEGLIDYVCPQVYWPFSRDVAPYGTIATWWATHITTPHTKLYIGMGLYRVNATTNPTETDFLDPNAKTEMLHEIQLNQNYPNISGSFIYQTSNMMPDSSSYKKDAVENGIKVAWNTLALAPSSKWKSSVGPAMPKNVTAATVSGGTQVSWQDGDTHGNTMYYAVYRFAAGDAAKSTSDPTKLIAVVGKDTTTYLDTATADSSTVSYVVTALDNMRNESTPNAATPVSAVNATASTTAGVTPTLPVSVQVKMSDGSTANMMVKWNAVDSGEYASAGSAFDVTGQVIYSGGNATGLNVQVHVTVTGKSIQYICPVVVQTEQYAAPQFPAQVTAVYSDHTAASLPVTWPATDASTYAAAAPTTEYAHPTVFGIQGTVEGTSLKAEGNYIVYPAVSSYSAVSISTHAGVGPVLPSTVTATYTDGSTANVAVTWDAVSPASYEKAGSFTVSGTVQGAAKKVTASVTVKPAVTIVDTQPVSVKTVIGVAPQLPATVKATYSDGSSSSLNVTWDSVDPSAQCASTHRFQVAGTINDTDYAVTATVEVDASRVLDDFENGTVSGGVAQSKISWKPDSAASPSTAPTLSYDTGIFHSGQSSLKVAYDFTGHAGTCSAYLRPNQGSGVVFQPGAVPSSIGFWVYGNNVTTYGLRCEFRAGTSSTAVNTNQTISNTLNFTGWKYISYPVDPSYQSTGLCVTLLPGIIEINSASKVNTAIYIDDLTAVYGTETRDTTEISAAVTKASALYAGASDAMKALSEYGGLHTAIQAATAVMNDGGSANADLYAATDSLNAAAQSFTDKSALYDAVTAADAKISGAAEGNLPGQYVTGTLSAFRQVIASARSVLQDGSATHVAVQTAIFTLSQAESGLDGSIVPPLDLTALKNAIQAATALKAGSLTGTQAGQYPGAAVNALTDAIAAANLTLNGTGKAQSDIDAAAQTLNGAVTDFLACVTPEESQNISAPNVISQIRTDSESAVKVPLFGAATVPAGVFQALAGKDKDLTFAVENSSHHLTYSWTFHGTDIQAEPADVDLAISFEKPTDPAVLSLLTQIDTADSTFVNFAYHGQLPGQATIRLFVGDRYSNGSKLTLYYLNTDSGAVDTVGQLSVSDGYVTFPITHCSTYLLQPESVSGSTAGSDDTTGAGSTAGTGGTAAPAAIPNPKTGNGGENLLPICLLAIGAAAAGMLVSGRRYLRKK